MDKSQLRRLALDYADGQILAQEYRRRRRDLIDGIVDGSVPVRREPSRSPLAASRELLSGASTARAPGSSGPAFRWPLWLGGASLACMVVVIVLLAWPAAEPPAPAPAPVVPASELPRARTLVESFLARRDFAPDTVASFGQQWSALPPPQRDEARGSLWFASLVRALRDEVKTQKALASLAGGEAALERARRVHELGKLLGVAGQLPGIDDAGTNALDRFAPTAAGEAAATQAPQQASPPAVTAGAATVVTAAGIPAPAADADLTGRQWLERRDDAELTLQLFAVNGLGRVEQLMAGHPELPLRILASDGAAPRYRVFHGAFTDETAARRAYDALPDDITRASGGAIVKSFAAVREDLAGGAGPGPAGAPAAARDYTLQLFASGNRANAESLVKAFPGLPLQLRQLDGDAAAFRVVYGRFESEDSARAASQGLPEALLSKVGKPLAKLVAETGDAVVP